MRNVCTGHLIYVSGKENTISRQAEENRTMLTFQICSQDSPEKSVSVRITLTAGDRNCWTGVLPFAPLDTIQCLKFSSVDWADISSKVREKKESFSVALCLFSTLFLELGNEILAKIKTGAAALCSSPGHVGLSAVILGGERSQKRQLNLTLGDAERKLIYCCFCHSHPSQLFSLVLPGAKSFEHT